MKSRKKLFPLLFFGIIILLSLLVLLKPEIKALDFNESNQEAISQFRVTETADNPVVTGINNNYLKTYEGGEYKFLSIGHIYGNPVGLDENLQFPAQTFINFLPELQTISLEMLFLLGDIVPGGEKQYFETLEKVFLSELDFPVFNAVGNHDVEDRTIYEERYGKTFTAFSYASDIFLIIDTELVSCKIPGEQYEMIRETLETALSNINVKNIFIFMHRVLFIDNEVFVEKYGREHSLVRPNTWLCFEENDYQELLNELILPAAKIKPVYWFAGDVGAFDGNLSPYYQKFPDSNLSMIAVGIGDSENDAAALVTVSKNSEVLIEFISLTGKEMMPAEDYDLEYWLSLEDK